MTNQNHLNTLKEGVAVWNQWRLNYLEVCPDLRGADLSGADLTEVNLHKADLAEANLSTTSLRMADLRAANLCNADLSGAHLRAANLRAADLRGANLHKANLADTNLAGANLIEADLSEANFSRTDLSETDLTNATTWETTFTNIDLSQTKGLETIQHEGPSSVGINTIYRSHGNIPEVFLRGAGVPEPFITNMRALVDSLNPIDYYTCFISYSSQDQDFATRLHADLQSKGVRCWFAPHNLKIGERIRDRIDESIRIYEKLLLILSKDSIESDWIEDEVEIAQEKERLTIIQQEKKRTMLFPIRLDDAIKTTTQAWATKLYRQRHIGDFTCWKEHDAYQHAFQRLLHDLKQGI